ncbi:MAG: bifunctional (p)ppGpp synthetase/guanosine-3',5'-bis(diphosphate) 3'-pyrophosphohydrolase [Nitrospirota bacterium]
MILPEDIVQKILSYNPDANVELFHRAYNYSAKVHIGQVRLSGEPYLMHPLEVAGILADLKLDVVTIVAGLLHDTLEDTPTTIDEIRELFGEDVAFLVDGITKIAQIEFKTKVEQQAENFRKMLLAMARDIRIILIKLADRLHNMRTLKYLSPAKQKAIAQETLDIYAPLSNRFGIGWMKIELEDLSLQYLEHEIYNDLVSKVAKRQEEREGYVRELINIVKENLAKNNLNGEVTGRPKHYYSIYRKMSEQGISFNEVFDITGLRIITETKADCYAILGMIHSLWIPVPGRFKDYIGVPKSNRYQSLHTTVIGPRGERVEFQIRTKEMHRIAEEGIAAHWSYKEKLTINEKDKERFAWLRQLVDLQTELTDARDFLETIKVDLFPDVVYVFTPKGDIKELPRGSTPVDFAYSIHTEVGHRCVGAKVSGRIVPLRHQLRNGDTVEIQTQSGHMPSRDWLKFVNTPRARARIKQWIKAEERKRSIELGREILERELKKHDLNPVEALKSKELIEVVKVFGISDLEGLFVAIGYGRLSGHQVVNRLIPEKIVEEIPPKRFKKPVRTPKGISVHGAGDIMVHLSRCCNPLPGDRIIGFVTRGRGITIHTDDCQNLRALALDKDRLIDVKWEKGKEITHPVRISVYTIDKPGLLANVSSAVTSAEANISHASASTTPDKKAYLNFTVEVRDLSHLQNIMKKVSQVEGVISVRRVKAA